MAEDKRIFGEYSDLVTEILDPKIRKDKLEFIEKMKLLKPFITLSDIRLINDKCKKGFKFDIGRVCRAAGDIENAKKFSEKYFAFKSDRENWNTHYSNMLHSIKQIMGLSSIYQILTKKEIKPKEIIVRGNLTLFPIKGFEESEYYITSCGKIFSTQHTEVIEKKPQFINGYHYVTLYVDAKAFQKLIHILVATTFIENLDLAKNIVNHKNGNKIDNNVDNLEWVTAKENSKHAHETGLVGKHREHEYLSKERYEELKPWSIIKGFPDYDISWFGFVINKRSRLLMKTRGSFYQKIDLRDYKGEKITFSLNRLVCRAHLPPPRWFLLPDDKSLNILDNFDVDHLNWNKTNDCIDNLEFKTHQENCENRIHEHCVKIKMFDDMFEEEFDSIVECIKKYPEFKHQGISKVINNKRELYKGYYFEKV
jgi:HNH endonuclease